MRKEIKVTFHTHKGRLTKSIIRGYPIEINRTKYSIREVETLGINLLLIQEFSNSIGYTLKLLKMLEK